jgi:uncharacterized circularly permuted ATP-grasp superfamily protein
MSKRNPSYLVVKGENNHVLYQVEQSGGQMTIVDARELSGAHFPTRTIDFIQSAKEWATLSEAASARLDNGLDEFEIFEQEIIPVSKPNATYMLISKSNGVVIAAGGFDHVSGMAEMFNQDAAEMVACVNWVSPEGEK